MSKHGLTNLMNKIGGVTGGAGRSGSFLPDDYIRAKAERRSAAISLLLFGVVLTGVIGAFMVTNRQWVTVKQEQARVDADFAAEGKKLEELRKLETQKEEMLERAVIASAVLERVPRSILLSEVVNRLPEGAAISEFQLTSRRVNPPSAGRAGPGAAPASTSASKSGKGAQAAKGPAKREQPKPARLEFTVVIQGLATGMQQVADFHTALRGIPLLTAVKTVESKDVTVEETVVTKFRIEAMIKPEADVRTITPLRVARAEEPATGTRTGRAQLKPGQNAEPVPTPADGQATVPTP